MVLERSKLARPRWIKLIYFILICTLHCRRFMILLARYTQRHDSTQQKFTTVIWICRLRWRNPTILRVLVNNCWFLCSNIVIKTPYDRNLVYFFQGLFEFNIDNKLGIQIFKVTLIELKIHQISNETTDCVTSCQRNIFVK